MSTVIVVIGAAAAIGTVVWFFVTPKVPWRGEEEEETDPTVEVVRSYSAPADPGTELQDPDLLD